MSSSRNCGRIETESVLFSELPVETFTNFYMGIASSFCNVVHEGSTSWVIVLHQKSTELCLIPIFTSRGEILHLFVPQLPHHSYNRDNIFLYKMFCYDKSKMS